MNFVIVDLSNLFARCRFVVKGESDPYTKAAVSVSLVFRSLRKLYRDIGLDHIVFAVDAGSWRSSVYPMYKARRKASRIDKTPSEQEEDTILYESLNKLIEYLEKKTRCTVLKKYNIEGDDFVARFIQNHPDDNHVIVSGDSDFIQLLSDKVKIYDGINERMITTSGVFDAKGKSLPFKIESSSGKIKVSPTSPEIEPEWWKKALFIKIIRGDSGDGIFSCYPGISYKGTSKRIGIEQAWEDRFNKEYHWNNFFLQEWTKADKATNEKKNVRVIDEFKINESLIDLSKQPDDIKQIMDETINESTSKEMVAKNVGFDFLKFCSALDLPGLAEETDHAVYLNLPYKRTK